MRIAVDAMGGDYAPVQIVAGTVQAARRHASATFILVGDEQAVNAELAKHGSAPSNIEVVHASEVVGMEESPANAIRRKKDSSISRSVELVKSGDCQGVFSAGNTGAAVAATTLKLRTLEGVDRPAIATVIPTRLKPFILLDAGATTDCSAELLLQFAVMGAAYSSEILGQANPRVGLLNIGGEEAKGNDTVKEAYRLLEASQLNFVGNVENVYDGSVDVAVCDGFVGNVVLKTSESAAKAIGAWLKSEFTSNPIHMLGALLLSRGLNRIKRRSDPAAYGGAPLLGVNGICIIGHGSSSDIAVANGLHVATEFVNHKINERIVNDVKRASASA